MENIEAMLCAYIEGDLDPAGRAEIEKHLQANPQHRKLIKELIATRDLVRNLPRVGAQSDVGESLRGQVERSILLDDTAPRAATSGMRLNRWPQFAAVAAVFVLTAGLGIAVIKMVMPPAKSPQFTQVAPVQPMEKQTADRDDAFDLKSEAKPAPAGPMTPTSPIASAPAVPGNINNQLTENAGNSTVDLSAIENRLRTSGYAPPPRDQVSPVYLVIDNASATTSNEKLSRFLTSNGISWTPIPETVPVNNPSTMPSFDNVAGNNGAQHSVDAIAPDVAQANPAQLPNEQTTTRPDGPDHAGQNTILDVRKGPAEPAIQMAFARQSLQAAQNANTNTTTQDVYVAHGVTRKQADELRVALADQVGPVVYDSADKSDAAAATQPSDKLMAKGAAGAGGMGGGAGGGAFAMRRAVALKAQTDDATKDAPATRPEAQIAAGDLILVHASNLTLPEGAEQVQSVHVNDDGKLSLPGLAPVEAAGQTSQQIQDSLARAYVDANLGAGAQVVIHDLSAPKPADAPAVKTDESMDVVIVIQNSTAPSSNAATAPAAAAPMVPAAPATQP